MKTKIFLLMVALMFMMPLQDVQADEDDKPINILCYNMGYRREFTWDKIGDKCIAMINKYNVDIIGSQETHCMSENGRLAAMVKKFPRFALYGKTNHPKPNRLDGPCIIYDKDKFTVDEENSTSFWLSDTPDVHGSNTWGSKYVRMCVVARLIQKSTNRSFYFYDTHWSFSSKEANFKGAQLIMKHMSERKYKDDPVIFMGDLNLRGAPSLTYMLGTPAQGKTPPFAMKVVVGGNIDWILSTKEGFKVLKTDGIDTRKTGLTDHPIYFCSVSLTKPSHAELKKQLNGETKPAFEAIEAKKYKEAEKLIAAFSEEVKKSDVGKWIISEFSSAVGYAVKRSQLLLERGDVYQLKEHLKDSDKLFAEIEAYVQATKDIRMKLEDAEVKKEVSIGSKYYSMMKKMVKSKKITKTQLKALASFAKKYAESPYGKAAAKAYNALGERGAVVDAEGYFE